MFLDSSVSAITEYFSLPSPHPDELLKAKNLRLLDEIVMLHKSFLWESFLIRPEWWCDSNKWWVSERETNFLVSMKYQRIYWPHTSRDRRRQREHPNVINITPWNEIPIFRCSLSLLLQSAALSTTNTQNHSTLLSLLSTHLQLR